ncbi:chaperone modulator CbpM [Streptomyces enissocaesilis]|uniref:chaperone modulator CbpM n=1 Tax=Streptomyces TaxID=1883 RepID=UPI0006B9910E|nr:chaperone modulator CbpM [Streptomyces coelicoflavus]KPC63127.1 MerR family transcriptional regulator [Streptomyces sp. NRRL WC-3753]MCQ4198790.1 chaperone modulator CbpM [Streptomyces coelicoflavus]WDI18935.1 chaperone modulator CbpM [Streptomyces enissocaesilis]
MKDRPEKAAGTVRAGMGDRPVRMNADTTASTAVRFALVPTPRLSLDAVARRSGLHPDLVRRFVALGLVDAERDAAGHLVFDPTAPAVLARIQRLRAGLCLNYAAIGLVLDLLDRISLLESALRLRGTRSDTPPWT